MKLAIRPEVLMLVAATLFGFAAAEGGLRLYGALSRSTTASEIRNDPLGVLVRPHGDLGFRQTPNRVYRYPNGTFATSNAQGFRGPVVDSVKPPHTVRVVLLGSSTTHGWGTPDDSTIDAFMRRELSARRPNLRFEVLNFAFDGYDSYQVLQRLRTDGLPRDPDIVVTIVGATDVANTRFQNLRYADPRTLIWEGVLHRLRDDAVHGPGLWTRAKHYLYIARVPEILRRRLNQSRSQVSEIHPNLAAADYLERNVDQMVALATNQGACVFLSADPSGLRWYPPDAKSDVGYWVGSAAQTQMVRDTMDARVRLAALRAQAAGKTVRYIPHNLDQEAFLDRGGFRDDAHLSVKGNREVAHDFVEALLPLLPLPPAPANGGSLSACAAKRHAGM